MDWHDRLRGLSPGRKHFGQDIAPKCLRIGKNGAVQIALDKDWPELTRNLRRLGDVVATTQNQSASLTQTGSYPDFKICACGRSACSLNDGLVFNFAAWRRVWATRRQNDDGVWRALTIVGENDRDNHQIWLTDKTREKEFIRLTRRFQGNAPAKFENVPRQRLSWPQNQPPAMQPSSRRECFRRRKREYVENSESGSRALHRESLAEIWRNVLAERIWLGTTLMSESVIHSVLWQPTSFEENAQALTAGSDNVFFRCRLERIVELWAVPFSADADSICALEAYDAQDDLLFALVALPEWKTVWNELLRWLPAV